MQCIFQSQRHRHGWWQASGGGGSGGKHGSGGRVASEDGHRDGHSRERGTRWCRSLGLHKRPDVWGSGPTADSGPGAIAAGRRAEARGATPAPSGLAQPGGAPSRAGWSKDAGGRPEPKGTAHPRVGHQRPPAGPAQTAWESPGLNWHSQTTGCRNRSSEADRGF